MKKSKTYFKKLAILTAQIASDKKAKNIKVSDIRQYSSLAEFVVIVTIESGPQIQAIADDIIKKLKQEDAYRLHADGHNSRTWRIYDYGGFFIHLVNTEERKFYALDKVYHLGKSVQWRKVKKTVKPAIKKTR
jgi:ribosome-associated protein